MRGACEQHQAVLQVGHDLVDVVFQGGENLLGIAHLPADVGDFLGYHPVLVAPAFVLRNGFSLTGGNTVQAPANALQWTKREMRESCGEDQRKQDRSAGKKQSMLQLWGKFVLQEHGGDAYANTPEGFAI